VPRAQVTPEQSEQLTLLVGLVRASRLLASDSHTAAQDLLDDGVSPTPRVTIAAGGATMGGVRCVTCGAAVDGFPDRCPVCGADLDVRLIELGPAPPRGLRRAERPPPAASARPPGRRSRRWLPIAVGLAVLWGAFALTADDPSVDADDAANEPTTASDATSTAAALSDLASPATTTTQVIPGAPLLGERAGFQVAFVGQRRTLLLDVDTGVLRVVQGVEQVAVLGVTDLGLLVRSFVAPGSSANLAVWPAPYDGSGAIVLNETWTASMPALAWVSSSGEQVWAVSGGPDSPHVVRYDLVEETASTLVLEDLGFRLWPFGVVGDALALGAPGGTYLLSSDGRIDRISTGQLIATGRDWLLVDMCDQQLSCEVQVIDPGGRPISTHPEMHAANLLGPFGPFTGTSSAIAPDGRLATVRSDSVDSATLVVDGVEVSPLRGRAVLGWSPDGRWLLALDTGELVVIDTTSRSDPVRIALRAGLSREDIVTFPTAV
jgi:hypothetical protein